MVVVGDSNITLLRLDSIIKKEKYGRKSALSIGERIATILSQFPVSSNHQEAVTLILRSMPTCKRLFRKVLEVTKTNRSVMLCGLLDDGRDKRIKAVLLYQYLQGRACLYITIDD